ncbi:Myotubularin-related protein 14, partial [Pseudolycoriella hygida]
MCKRDITPADINDLLSHSGLKQCSASDDETALIEKCNLLWKLDYSLAEVKNSNGELSSNYPSHLLIPESERERPGLSPSTIYEQQTFDAAKFREKILAARLARCRARFPVPVILFRGKYVCRSATLSGGPEIYSRHSYDLLCSAAYNVTSSNSNDGENTPENETAEEEIAEEASESFGTGDAAEENESKPKDWRFIDEVRQKDKQLIKYLNVGTIVDLMVENKKVKFYLNVTSSEKIDKENRYAEFKLICLPYPGCEFFKEFKDNNFCAEQLAFDWGQSFVDAKIEVPKDMLSSPLNIAWEDYTKWEIIEMTQNYIKLLLKYLCDNTSGVLVHCISGWDRTPLFISLLRILLWADGAIHQSLNVQQMLYFTLAYDWFLFGHHLPDRLAKGEEIMFFCFYVLKCFTDGEYCTTLSQIRSPSYSGGDNNTGVDVDISFPEVDQCSPMFESDDGDSNTSNKQPEVRSASSNGNISQDSNGSISNLEAQNGNSNSNGSHLPRTSPVSVPANSRNRTRNDSFSSINNSWHVISGTGSLRSSDSYLTSTNNVRKRTTSSEEILEKRTFRINSLRQMFYSAYFATVGSNVSDVWNYFEKSKTTATASCNICKTVLKVSIGSTSGLIKHAKLKHEIIIKKKICAGNSTSTSTSGAQNKITEFFQQKKTKDSFEVVMSRMVALDDQTGNETARSWSWKRKIFVSCL